MFKRGVEYTRDEIARVVRPENPPRGGDWTTGYARIENNLFIFMNIGVAGRTGHDFENHYDEKSQTLVWFSKPNKHSSNPLFQKILSGELTPYFFARWNQKPPFTFLGTGNIVNFEDGYKTPQGHECIRLIVSVKELQDIITPHQKSQSPVELIDENEQKSSFLFEKHLEDFLVSNWTRTPLAREFEIYQKDGDVVGQQFRTNTGPIDILGQRKDKSDFLVVELKRDRASDVVVGQTLRYMGWVKEHLCTQEQNVTGCIIAQRKDEKLDYALKQVNTIQFMRFEVDFRLIA
jgi:hypothetical protein